MTVVMDTLHKWTRMEHKESAKKEGCVTHTCTCNSLDNVERHSECQNAAEHHHHHSSSWLSTCGSWCSCLCNGKQSACKCCESKYMYIHLSERSLNHFVPSHFAAPWANFFMALATFFVPSHEKIIHIVFRYISSYTYHAKCCRN